MTIREAAWHHLRTLVDPETWDLLSELNHAEKVSGGNELLLQQSMAERDEAKAHCERLTKALLDMQLQRSATARELEVAQEKIAAFEQFSEDSKPNEPIQPEPTEPVVNDASLQSLIGNPAKLNSDWGEAIFSEFIRIASVAPHVTSIRDQLVTLGFEVSHKGIETQSNAYIGQIAAYRQLTTDAARTRFLELLWRAVSRRGGKA